MKIKILLAVFTALLLILSACSEKPVEVNIKVSAILNGDVLEGATVLLDGKEVGQTDVKGEFSTSVSKLKEQKVSIEVVKVSDTLKSKPWKTEFAIAKAESETLTKEFKAELKNYITIVASSKNQPLADTTIRRGKDLVGKTDSEGRLEYVFDSWPKKGLRLKADKLGYVAKTMKLAGNSGDEVPVSLIERAVLQFKAFSDSNGASEPIEGASIYMGKKLLGSTGSDGYFTYRHKGKHGDKVKITMAARGYIPSKWSKTITLEGKQTYKRNYFSEKPSLIKTGIYSFVSNTSGEDISSVLSKVKQKLENELFSESKAFVQIQNAKLVKLVRDSKLSLDRLKTRGWNKNRLSRSLDLLVLGSIGRNDDNDFIIEVNFHRKDGTLVMSHVVTASSDSNWRIGRAVGEVVENVLERYPFEGMVTAVNEDGYRINLGDDVFPISNSDVFELRSISRNSVGKIKHSKAVGTSEVDRSRSFYTMLEPIKQKVKIGDRVVRVDSVRANQTDFIQLSVKGGVEADVRELSGVNVYAEEKWIGITDSKGKLKVPARIGRDVDLVLYKHGYKQIEKSVEADKKGQDFAFKMKSYSSNLTITSNPSGATIMLDDKKIGVTPMKSPYPVTLGFHTLRLHLGGQYRDWEEVVEFNKSDENRTGKNAIKLHKDYVNIAEKLYNGGEIDGAIAAYKNTNSQHPDYAEARHRLAQIYLDDKRDYDASIREFENVRNLPEVKELVLKQYAVVYTNLGHAYYAKADSIMDVDKKEASRYFAKAVKALNTAKENTRFFPNESYDEILHDTYYYVAVSLHNLFKITGRGALRTSADLAWQQYFDYFPDKLNSITEYTKLKGMAQRLWDELRLDSEA